MTLAPELVCETVVGVSFVLDLASGTGVELVEALAAELASETEVVLLVPASVVVFTTLEDSSEVELVAVEVTVIAVLVKLLVVAVVETSPDVLSLPVPLSIAVAAVVVVSLPSLVSLSVGGSWPSSFMSIATVPVVTVSGTLVLSDSDVLRVSSDLLFGSSVFVVVEETESIIVKSLYSLESEGSQSGCFAAPSTHSCCFCCV